MLNIILISFNFYMFSLNNNPVCWRNYTSSADQITPSNGVTLIALGVTLIS